MAFLIDPFEVGGGAVAAKITANVWEIVQLSNLATRYYTTEFDKNRVF